jgi:hypothetical protein
LLIRRLFGSKSEKLDAAQLELLSKDVELGKADASAEKAGFCLAPFVRIRAIENFLLVSNKKIG